MKEIDSFSFALGAVDCLCKMLAAGVKRMAVSRPWPDEDTRARALPYCREICGRYGALMYIEDDFLLTDLFPLEETKDKKLLLFFRDEGVLAVYRALKRQKTVLVSSGQYEGAARYAIARGLGALLSYPRDTIAAVTARNDDREA